MDLFPPPSHSYRETTHASKARRLNPLKLSEAVEKFSTWANGNRAKETARTYVCHARRLARFLGSESTQQDITPATLKHYLDAITQGRTSGARYMYITALRCFCEWLKQEGLIKGANPAKTALKLPRVVSKPHAPVTDAQALALWRATDKIEKSYRAKLARCVLALLCGTGLRCGELLAVDVCHVSLDEGLLYIPNGKGGKEAYVGLNEETVSAISDLLAARDPKTRHNGLLAWTLNQRLHKHSLYSLLDELTLLAGLKVSKPLRPHQFRHGFATRLDAKGASMFQIQTALRHSKVATSERYVHSNAEKLRAVAALASIQMALPLLSRQRESHRKRIDLRQAH